MRIFLNKLFSDNEDNISFMRLLCLLSFLQSCILCYVGLFHSKDGITVELGSVIFTYISAAFLGKHYSKLVELKTTKTKKTQQILSEG